MLTIFCTTKPFAGFFDPIQKNAIRSWQLLDPRPQVVIFGEGEGVSEACKQLDVRHVPKVKCSPSGLPLLSDMFAQADALASTSLLCYIDADIIFLGNLMQAVRQALEWRGLFLLTGRSGTLDQRLPLDFAKTWEEDITARAIPPRQNRRNVWGLDYFIFRKGSFPDFPPFTVGRPGWDNWFLYHVRARGGRLVDGTGAITAIHQEHTFEFVEQSQSEIWKGADGQRNLQIVRSRDHLFSALDATHFLTQTGLRPALDLPHLARGVVTFPVLHPTFSFLSPVIKGGLLVTRPARKWAGLTVNAMARRER